MVQSTYIRVPFLNERVKKPTMREITDILVSNTNSRGSKPRILARTVMDFFSSSGRIIYIPDYQRPYSWGTPQRKKLFTDLEKACDADERWFLGPIYTTSEDVDSNTVDLLDGQQRMTTICIILREIIAYEGRTSDSLQWNQEVIKNNWRDVVSRCKTALIDMNSSALKPKFHTDLSVRSEFETWISCATNINTKAQYKEAHFKTEERWQLTSQRISQAIVDVTQWIDNVVESSEADSHPHSGVTSLQRYITHLLDGLWLIEIPFNSDDDILKVFEAMNNRGLGLSLSDKMRFKTISRAEAGEKRKRITEAWGKLYESSEVLANVGLFKGGVDEFLEVYLVTKSAQLNMRDATDTEQRELIIEAILEQNNPQDVLDEILQVTNYYEEYILDGGIKAILKLEKLQKEGAVNGWKNDKLDQLRALTNLAKGMIGMSKNFRILLHHFGTRYDLERSSFPLTRDLWAAIRILFQEVVVYNSSSNTVRDKMRECVGIGLHPGLSSQLEFGVDDMGWTLRNKLNLFIQNNDSESFATLLLFQWFDDKNTLAEMTHHTVQGSHTHLEHVCPKKWTKHWGQVDWEEEISAFRDPEGEWWEKCLMDDELIPTTTGKYKSTILECIGNKAILRAKTNIKSSNKFWIEKKADFTCDNVNLYPNWREESSNRISEDEGVSAEEKIYWKDFQNWDTRIIVQNARLLIDTLEKNWTNQWDE